MTDETKLLDMTEEELVEVLRSYSPANPFWVGAKAALEVKNARQMASSGKRLELATYVILLVTVVQLALLVIPFFRR